VIVLFTAVTVQAAPPTVDAPPDADFLEFLGSWDTGEPHQKWIDPFQLDDPALLEPDQPAGRSPQGDRRDEPRTRRTDDQTIPKQQAPDSARPGRGVTP
jgi:hypothetical protein